MTPDEAIGRARSLTKYLLRYSLGAGDYDPRDPDDPSTHDLEPVCDCSGFMAWVLRYQRKQTGYANGWGWVSTDSMISDALAKSRGQVTDGWWDIVKGVRPGDLVVYGSKYGRNWRGKTVRKRVGHVGIVSFVPEWPNWSNMRVVHCSAGNFRRTGRAVQETDARAWDQPKSENPNQNTYFLRYTKYGQ